jgi:peptide/nickel transport system permease protein
MSLKTGIAAAAALLLAAAFAAPLLLSLPGPTRIDIRQRLLPPGLDHLLGTDALGRDGLARWLEGTRSTITAAILGTLAAIGLGWPLGAAARAWPDIAGRCVAILAHGLYVAPAVLLLPRWSCRILMALVCAFGALPATWLAVVAAAGFGFRAPTGPVLLGLLLAPAVAYALYRGLSGFGVVATSVFVWALVKLGHWDAVGLGTPPPFPSWGGLLADHAATPWPALATGTSLLLIVLGAFCLGDALTRRRPTPALPLSAPSPQA